MSSLHGGSVPVVALAVFQGLLAARHTDCRGATLLALESAATPCAAGRSAVAQDARYLEEVRALAADAGVQRAFRAIEELEPRTHGDLILLTEIPAPPFKEEQRAKRYAEMLREAGLDSVYIDEVGNVIGVRRGRSSEKTVALDGHLDTVFPEGTDVRVRIRGDTLFAPGIGDDTRGLVLVLTVLRAMNQAGIQTEGDVLFIGTVGEEGLGDLRGVKHLFSAEGPPIDAWIAVDGGDEGRVLHQGIGSRRYRITFRGPGGHSWGAFGLANPHHALGRAVRYFAESADGYTRTGPQTSYNVGRIGGGTSVNAIPFESWMEVDMRSVSPQRLAGVDSILQTSIRRALDEENAVRRHGPPLTADVEKVGDRPSGEIPSSTPIVQRAIAATRYFGTEPAPGTGSTDSNIPIAKGLPAITIGRGGVGDGGHSPGEWWLNEKGDIAIKKALLIVLAEAGLATRRPATP
ncbi:MAG: M20/M25/M40 family metallo-hydrolase [Gemmatimonadetes bacterium]|nr:M20/M25/M40 family metallo-hydrolase [Gemmatimonadota bacterium]